MHTQNTTLSALKAFSRCQRLDFLLHEKGQIAVSFELGITRALTQQTTVVQALQQDSTVLARIMYCPALRNLFQSTLRGKY